MHKGHCSYFAILKMAAVSSTIILPLSPNEPFDHTTSAESAASADTVNRTVSSSTTHGTAKTPLKVIGTDLIDDEESKKPSDNTNAQRRASC